MQKLIRLLMKINIQVQDKHRQEKINEKYIQIVHWRVLTISIDVYFLVDEE